ncbi:hemagglutinin, partial [Neisseria meningitidis]|nr:hemagglutinin [Neisseria meningitidis]
DVFSNHGLGGLLEEGAHGKSPKCLGGNLGDFGEFCKGLNL